MLPVVAEALGEEAAGLKVQQQAKPRHWELTIASGFLLVLFLLRKTMPNFTTLDSALTCWNAPPFWAPSSTQSKCAFHNCTVLCLTSAELVRRLARGWVLLSILHKALHLISCPTLSSGMLARIPLFWTRGFLLPFLIGKGTYVANHLLAAILWDLVWSHIACLFSFRFWLGRKNCDTALREEYFQPGLCALIWSNAPQVIKD